MADVEILKASCLFLEVVCGSTNAIFIFAARKKKVFFYNLH